MIENKTKRLHASLLRFKRLFKLLPFRVFFYNDIYSRWKFNNVKPHFPHYMLVTVPFCNTGLLWFAIEYLQLLTYFFIFMITCDAISIYSLFYIIAYCIESGKIVFYNHLSTYCEYCLNLSSFATVNVHLTVITHDIIQLLLFLRSRC